jgi:hypothetical protein
MRQVNHIERVYQAWLGQTVRVGRLGQGICGTRDRTAAHAADRVDERLDVIQIRTIGTLAEVVIAALLEEECGS